MAVWCICDFCGARQQDGLTLAWVDRASVLYCLRFDLSTAMSEMCCSRFPEVSYLGIRLHGRENKVVRQVQV